MPFVTSTNEFGITFLSVPVCPHAGGVGLCELVQHLIIFDYISVSGSLENRLVIKCLLFPCLEFLGDTSRFYGSLCRDRFVAINCLPAAKKGQIVTIDCCPRNRAKEPEFFSAVCNLCAPNSPSALADLSQHTNVQCHISFKLLLYEFRTILLSQYGEYFPFTIGEVLWL